MSVIGIALALIVQAVQLNTAKLRNNRKASKQKGGPRALAMEVAERIRGSSDANLIERFEHAVSIIERALAIYGLQACSLSFNGGKDSTVLLHLVRAAVALHFPAAQGAFGCVSCGKVAQSRAQPYAQRTLSARRPPRSTIRGKGCTDDDWCSRTDAVSVGMLDTPLCKCTKSKCAPVHLSRSKDGIKAFFFERDDEFPEVRSFVDVTDEEYALGMEKLHTKDYKGGMKDVVEMLGTRAVFIGTRRGDPNAADQEHFIPSSPGWPLFMRCGCLVCLIGSHREAHGSREQR